MPVVLTMAPSAIDVDVLGRLDARDAQVGGLHRPLELDRQLDLGVGREASSGLAEQVELGHGHAVGLGQAEVLVGGGEPGVSAKRWRRAAEAELVTADVSADADARRMIAAAPIASAGSTSSSPTPASSRSKTRWKRPPRAGTG